MKFSQKKFDTTFFLRHSVGQLGAYRRWGQINGITKYYCATDGSQ